MKACADLPTEDIEAEIERLKNFCLQQRQFYANPCAFSYP